MSENVVPESNEPEMAFDDAMRSQLMNLAYHYLEQYFDERARWALGFGGPHEWREQDCLWAQFREIEDALSSGERIEEFAFCIDELWEYLSDECWELDQLLTEPPSDEAPLEADEYDSMVVYQCGDDLSKVPLFDEPPPVAQEDQKDVL